MTCRYARMCKLYQPDHHTCQSKNAENGFCGAYKSFRDKEYEKGVWVGNLFFIRIFKPQQSNE